MFVVMALLIWACGGVWLAVTDYRTGLLPTRVIWPVAGAVWVLYSIAAMVGSQASALAGAAVGAAVCGAALGAVHFAHPPSMGFGDVRLSVLNGLLCGWWGWQVGLIALMAGFLLAMPEALFVLVRQGLRASRPLGPYLVAGTAVTVIWWAGGPRTRARPLAARRLWHLSAPP